ncbi:hypothetical protein Taro_038362, partial [Colocasia esculenta]|nr:hypothetical protein [Colocasia esculenta]
MFHVHAAVGCSCCYVACVASVVARCVHTVVAWLAGFSQDCSVLISTVAVPPQGLRCAVGLDGAFWQVFPERCLGGSGGGSPRTGLCCFYSSACCGVLFEILYHLVVGLFILVKVLPRIALCRFWQRFFQRVLCVRFRPPLCCPCGSKWCFLLLSARESLLLPVRQSRCSVFCVVFGADMVVALLKSSAFHVLLLWVSSGESPLVGHVLSRTVGAIHHVPVHECFDFVPSGALVYCVVPWVAPDSFEILGSVRTCLSTDESLAVDRCTQTEGMEFGEDNYCVWLSTAGILAIDRSTQASKPSVCEGITVDRCVWGCRQVIKEPINSSNFNFERSLESSMTVALVLQEDGRDR